MNSILYSILGSLHCFFWHLEKIPLHLNFNNSPARNIKLILLHEYIVLSPIILFCYFLLHLMKQKESWRRRSQIVCKFCDIMVPERGKASKIPQIAAGFNCKEMFNLQQSLKCIVLKVLFETFLKTTSNDWYVFHKINAYKI